MIRRCEEVVKAGYIKGRGELFVDRRSKGGQEEKPDGPVEWCIHGVHLAHWEPWAKG